MDEFSAALLPSLGGKKGEPLTPSVSAVTAHLEETDGGKAALPSLDSLVSRIPAEVRETLEDLFRAKFTAVRRVPARHLDKT